MLYEKEREDAGGTYTFCARCERKIRSASATRAMFLIIYCPSNVGTNIFLHTMSGSKKRGRVVMMMCAEKRKKTIDVFLGKRNKMPIMHSNMENAI